LPVPGKPQIPSNYPVGPTDRVYQFGEGAYFNSKTGKINYDLLQATKDFYGGTIPGIEVP